MFWLKTFYNVCAGNMGFTIKCTRLECLSLYMCRMFTYHTLLLFLWSTQDIQSYHFSVTFPLWIWCELEEQIQRMRWHPTPVLLPENPMDRGAWWAAVHGVTKSQTWPRDFTFTFHFHALEKEIATHSRILAWEIPWTEEPGGLQSKGSQKIWTGLSD